MAKRRELKRNINNICTILFAEGMAAAMENEHPENAKALLYSIIKLQNEYICRISHVEPGLKPSVYFKDLTEKFTSRVGEIVDQICNK